MRGVTAVITGGASGIGRACAEILAQRGTAVIIADRNATAGQEVAQAIGAAGGQAIAVVCDVTDRESVEQVYAAVVAQYGTLDLALHAAGIGMGGEFRDIPEAAFDHCSAVDYAGVVNCTRVAYRYMVTQGRGTLVNVASMVGLFPFPTATVYAAAKAAIVNFTVSLAYEAADLGVYVSVVCPGLVDTPLYSTGPTYGVDQARMVAWAKRMLPVRFWTPTEAAHRILRGLDRRERLIVFPFYARAAWRVYQLCPALFAPLFRYFLRSFRTLRPAEPA